MSFPLRPWLIVFALAFSVYAAGLFVVEQKTSGAALLRLFSWQGLVAAGLCLLSYLLRGLRWIAWMKQLGRDLALAQGLRFYLAGYAFTPTPGNVGEAIRAMLPTRHPLPLGSSLALFGAERLADLMCLVLLALPATLWLLPSLPVWLWLVVLACVLLAGRAVSGKRWRPMVLARLPWLGQAWSCLAARPASWFLLTMLAWIAQGIAVWLLCAMMLVLPVTPFQATSFYAFSMVGGALSMLPAGLGGTEAIMLALGLGHGAALGVVVALTVMVRLLTLWFAVALGVVCLLYSVLVLKDLRIASGP